MNKNYLNFCPPKSEEFFIKIDNDCISYRIPVDIEHEFILKSLKKKFCSIKLALFSLVLFSFLLLCSFVSDLGDIVVLCFLAVFAFVVFCLWLISFIKEINKFLFQIKNKEYQVVDCFPINSKTESYRAKYRRVYTYYFMVKTKNGNEIEKWFRIDKKTFYKYKSKENVELFLVKTNDGKLELLTK